MTFMGIWIQMASRGLMLKPIGEKCIK